MVVVVSLSPLLPIPTSNLAQPSTSITFSQTPPVLSLPRQSGYCITSPCCSWCLITTVLHRLVSSLICACCSTPHTIQPTCKSSRPNNTNKIRHRYRQYLSFHYNTSRSCRSGTTFTLLRPSCCASLRHRVRDTTCSPTTPWQIHRAGDSS